jgi:hypothetical protein
MSLAHRVDVRVEDDGVTMNALGASVWRLLSWKARGK